MTALFVKPYNWTKNYALDSVDAPLENMNTDVPSLVWKQTANSNGDFDIRVDIGSNSLEYDTVALLGTNLPIATYILLNNDSGSSAFPEISANNPMWSGYKSPQASSNMVRHFPTISGKVIRVLIQTGIPDFEATAQRLVIGKSVSTAGVDSDAELEYEDQSVITDGPNFTSVEEYSVLPSWKVKVSQITEDAWYNDWSNLLLTAGQKRGILFVSDLENLRQQNICYGRFQSAAKAKHRFHDSWQAEMTIRALSQ